MRVLIINFGNLITFLNNSWTTCMSHHFNVFNKCHQVAIPYNLHLFMQTSLVKRSLFFYKRFKMVITAYHFKGIKISNNMNMFFYNLSVHIKIIDAVRELTPSYNNTLYTLLSNSNLTAKFFYGEIILFQKALVVMCAINVLR